MKKKIYNASRKRYIFVVVAQEWRASKTKVVDEAALD